MGILWGLLKNNGWLFWTIFCIPNVVLWILCTPLLKTWQKYTENNCLKRIVKNKKIIIGYHGSNSSLNTVQQQKRGISSSTWGSSLQYMEKGPRTLKKKNPKNGSNSCGGGMETTRAEASNAEACHAEATNNYTVPTFIKC